MDRTEEIKTAVANFLLRLSPPRAIAGNERLMADEMADITAAVARHAPTMGFSEWWPKVGSEVMARMKARSWPLVSEVENVCRHINGAGRSGGLSNEAVEAAAIDRLESWFHKFGNQAPSQGNPSRTMALIRRGVLRDIRHARFCGFDLAAEQMEKAREMPIGPEEERHHNRVLDDLHAIRDRMSAHGDEFIAAKKNVKPKWDAA